MRTGSDAIIPCIPPACIRQSFSFRIMEQIRILSVLAISYVTLGQSLKLSELQFLTCRVGTLKPDWQDYDKNHGISSLF